MFYLFCEKHVRLEDLDHDHCFVRDVSYETSEGTQVFKKGEKTKHLWSYVEDRKKAKDPERYKLLTVWGQPKAWADTQVGCQLSQLIAEKTSQALIICDCLGSRWSEQSLVGHWSNSRY